MSWPKEIVLIGAGNVAWHLGNRLSEIGVCIAYVYARSSESAEQLASNLNCKGGNQLEYIPVSADLYLIAVNDSAIESVAQQLAGHIHKNTLVLHTSGATPSSILQPYFQRYGVFYPLQTFSKSRKLDFAQVPLCICTHQPQDFARVDSFAKKVSEKVYAVSDQQRLQLHLAAVFVNNFTNYLQHIGGTILNEHQLDAEILHPLLVETVAKLKDLSAEEAQTGPAVRGDDPTIERHLSQLEWHPEWQTLYKHLSKCIKNEFAD